MKAHTHTCSRIRGRYKIFSRKVLHVAPCASNRIASVGSDFTNTLLKPKRRGFRRMIHPALIFSLVLTAMAPESSRSQTARIISADSLWNMLALPQPKYFISEWGAGHGLAGGAWLDVGDALSNPTNLPKFKLYKIDLKLDWTPKGDEAYPLETTPSLHMLIHEFATSADAETAWKDGFDEQHVRKPRGPSSGEQLAKLAKRINALGQPKDLAEREAMIKAGLAGRAARRADQAPANQHKPPARHQTGPGQG